MTDQLHLPMPTDGAGGGRGSDAPPPPPGERLLTLRQVSSKVGVSGTTIYRRMQDSNFPRPRQIGASVRWALSEVEAWISQLPPTKPGG